MIITGHITIATSCCLSDCLMFGFGVCSFLKLSKELVCMAVLTLVVMVIKSCTFPPIF